MLHDDIRRNKLNDAFFISTDIGSRGDIKMADDYGIGDEEDQDVIFVKYTRQNTVGNAMPKSPLTRSPPRPSSPLTQADTEEKHKELLLGDTQFDTSSPSSDSSDQSLPTIVFRKRRRLGRRKQTPRRYLSAQFVLSSPSSDDESGDIDTGLPRNGSKDSPKYHDICNGCGTPTKLIQNLSVCPSGHRCCRQCLLPEVTSVLTKQSEVDLCVSLTSIVLSFLFI